MKKFLSRYCAVMEMFPSFTLREMITLTVLLSLTGFFFVQSFKSHQDEFNHTTDDLFELSELHAQLETSLIRTFPNPFPSDLDKNKGLFLKLDDLYKDFIEDITDIPDPSTESILINRLNSLFILQNDAEIDSVLTTYKKSFSLFRDRYIAYDAEERSLAKKHETARHSSFDDLLLFPHRLILSDLYHRLQQKEKNFVYLSNNYRTATYFMLIMIVLYGSRIFIRHYGRERARAVASSNAKTDFLANMSHEIRTPLNGIIGMTELLSATSVTEEQKRYLKSLRISAEGLTDLINDILDISKIESGHIDLESLPLNLEDILDEVLVGFGIRGKEKNISVIKTFSPSLPRLYQGDSTRIKQILINLIGNAVKFTAEGHVKISCLPSPAVPGDIRFEIEDTGIGIPEKNRKDLFLKFSQGDVTTTRKFGGTGLGLAICKNLVSLMGGDIGFFENTYKGTTFWFTLHLGTALPENLLQKTPHALIDTSSVRGKRILLAEDNDVNREYTVKILRDMGTEIVLAENGAHAVSLFRIREKPFDVILMDCRMPEMDGYEATENIRQIERRDNSERTPIIALTANAVKSDIDRCYTVGMDDYIGKPFRRNVLESALSKWLSRSKPPSASLPSVSGNHKTPQPSDVLIDIDIFNEMKEVMDNETETVIRHYFDSLPTYIRQIREGLDAKSYQPIIDAAHPLKSSSASLGAVKVRHLAASLEQGARQKESFDILEARFARLPTLADATVRAIETLMKEV